MPTVDFKGKSQIYAHDVSVPYRPLLPDQSKSVVSTPVQMGGGKPADPASTGDNLIIHGDNLHALKALLPTYAGRVKCIYIDPPYNTGSQAWVYNDKVNSPMMRQWLDENKPVDGEDLERHDKWMCMMWPRLQLLRELLSEDGVIFVSIDDHEQWRLLGMMQEVFGERNFVDTVIHVHNRGAVTGKHLREVNEFLLVFAKDANVARFGQFEKEMDDDEIKEDEHGPYRLGSGLLRIGLSGTPEDRPNLHFPIFVGPDGSISSDQQSGQDMAVLPIDGRGRPAVWRWSRNRVNSQAHNLLLSSHPRTKYQFTIKIRPDPARETFLQRPTSLWDQPKYSSATGTNAVKSAFGGERVFDFPKSVELVKDILRFANASDGDLVLDSFAGSGTTAQAVLELNREDGADRKFILVECEDYADTITAERVRRVIRGVPTARDEALREGLGGSFTYCTLGDPITVDGMLSGESMPAFDQLAAHLIYQATGAPVDPADVLTPGDPVFDADTGFVLETDRHRFHLFYRTDAAWLKGGEGALNDSRARVISETARAVDKKAVVFGPVRYVDAADLRGMGITFCQLPYELTAHRARAS